MFDEGPETILNLSPILSFENAKSITIQRFGRSYLLLGRKDEVSIVGTGRWRTLNHPSAFKQCRAAFQIGNIARKHPKAGPLIRRLENSPAHV